MSSLILHDVTDYVESNIGEFHLRRAESLKRLKLIQVLQRKNPYLFKAKNIQTAQDLVKTLLDAHLSAQEEGIFGDFLEGLAIFVCHKVFGAIKSAAEGIDMEFEKDETIFIVSIKSGPNWGNSSQIKRMVDNFKRAKRTLQTSGMRRPIIAVNGCCYGKENQPDKGDYFKYCGQEFWFFISNDEHLYLDIIEPLGHRAKQKNEEFMVEYNRIINSFTEQFLKDFCQNGLIDWEKLVQFNSSKKA